MPNFAQALKDEIRRAAAKEVLRETEALRSSNSALQRTVAELKRRVASLEHDVLLLTAGEKRLPESGDEVEDGEC